MSIISPFRNSQVEISELPAIQDIAMTKLDPSYLRVRLISYIIFALILCGVYGFIAYHQSDNKYYFMIATPVLLVLLASTFIATYFGFFRKGYAVRGRDILFKKGLIWQSVTAIPYNRIQHSEVNHGPIDRFFGLASLKLFTAGGATSDLSIPGLKQEEAYQIKEFITHKAGMDEEE